MIYFIYIIHLHIFHGKIWTQNWPAPNVSGFIAQLVERRTGIARSRVQAPLKSWIFFRLLYAIVKIAIITARIILHLISYPQFTYDLFHIHHSRLSLLHVNYGKSCCLKTRTSYWGRHLGYLKPRKRKNKVTQIKPQKRKKNQSKRKLDKDDQTRKFTNLRTRFKTRIRKVWSISNKSCYSVNFRGYLVHLSTDCDDKKKNYDC